MVRALMLSFNVIDPKFATFIILLQNSNSKVIPIRNKREKKMCALFL